MTRYQAKFSTETDPKKRRRTLLILPILILLLAVCILVFLLMEKPFSEITIEAGDPLPSADVFLPENARMEITYTAEASQINTHIPGDYSVTLLTWKGTYTCTLHVVDTTPPVGQVQSLTANGDSIPDAQAFVLSVQDITEVTASFASQPDPTLAGDQTVTILLTDTSGNETRLETTLTVVLDWEAPVIEGVQDITLYAGDSVAYRSGITVTDNLDESPELTVDSSNVDLSTPGVYEVRYIAADASGNISEVTAAVTVLEKKASYVELEVIYEKVDAILGSIITDSMTDTEKVTAIYNWVRRYCTYDNSSDTGDWRQAAYNMMYRRTGDCFNFFALCKLMMERLGIPNIDVEKIKNYPGDSMHYWSLVSVDGGETYYHFDATPRNGEDTKFILVTDAFLDAYSEEHKNCFNRDKTLYPATPEA